MAPTEIGASLGSLAAAGASVAYVSHLIRTSGRDRPHDPARVQHLVDRAPYHRLDNVLAK